MRYSTIVADPPWRYASTLPTGPWAFANGRKGRTGVTYPTLSAKEICALPVADLAEPDSHLYLWTTNSHLRHAWKVCEAWGFRYSTLLVWCKRPRGLVAGATYTVAAEYALFARRGNLSSAHRLDRNWFEWPRSNTHSRKPEAFLDLVEQVSPGPYLELFSRRQRLGWDTWGNEALEHVVLRESE